MGCHALIWAQEAAMQAERDEARAEIDELREQLQVAARVRPGHESDMLRQENAELRQGAWATWRCSWGE